MQYFHCGVVWFFILLISLNCWFPKNAYGNIVYYLTNWRPPSKIIHFLLTGYSCCSDPSAPGSVHSTDCRCNAARLIQFIHRFCGKIIKPTQHLNLPEPCIIYLSEGRDVLINKVRPRGLPNLSNSGYWEHILEVNAWLNAQTTRVSSGTDALYS